MHRQGNTGRLSLSFSLFSSCSNSLGGKMSCAGLARPDARRSRRVAVAVAERAKGRGGKRAHEERPAGLDWTGSDWGGVREQISHVSLHARGTES